MIRRRNSSGYQRVSCSRDNSASQPNDLLMSVRIAAEGFTKIVYFF